MVMEKNLENEKKLQGQGKVWKFHFQSEIQSRSGKNIWKMKKLQGQGKVRKFHFQSGILMYLERMKKFREFF